MGVVPVSQAESGKAFQWKEDLAPRGKRAVPHKPWFILSLSEMGWGKEVC